MTDAAYDVFISYARDDARRARVVRDKLTALGLRVFFDTEGVETGEEFPVIIDRAVKGARCVLGLWSRRAFTGRWVRIESRIGLDQKKLVAATLDAMRPDELPAEFYNVNIESLADFDGQDDHQGWRRILRAIAKRVGRAELAPPQLTAATAEPATLRLPRFALGGPQQRAYAIAAVVGVAVIVALALFNPVRLGPSPVAANRAHAPGADISGAWRGVYSEAGRETRFDLTLETAGAGRFTGHASEPDIYGLIGGQTYSADISGEARADGAVSFTKTYSGAGGFLRSVRYEGRLSADGRSISGTWDAGAVQGAFQMQRR
jgi:hypothetical protein